MCFLGHISKEEDEPAGLALISSIRKRVLNLPGDLAADKEWRERLTMQACVGTKEVPLRCLFLPRRMLMQAKRHLRML